MNTTRHHPFEMDCTTSASERTGQPTTVRGLFHLDGLTCASDAVRVERGMAGLTGIVAVTVNPITEVAFITFDPHRANSQRVHAYLDATGYGPATTIRT